MGRRILMDHVTHLQGLIGRLGLRIEEVIAPFAEAVERLTTIPGVEQRDVGFDPCRYSLSSPSPSLGS